MRLDPGLRIGTYATFSALIVTGAAWLAADQLKDTESGEFWQAVGADMLMLHGGCAMIALVLLGALIPVHFQRSWRAGRNRISGSIMMAVNASLIVTAFALYYAGSDALRTFAADIHIAVGLGLPAVIITHIALGRRMRALTVRPLLQPVTFSEDRGSP
jgi:hypothetical protein